MRLRSTWRCGRLWSSTSSTSTVTHASFEDDEVGSRPFWHSYHAEVRTACSVGVASIHLVDLVLGRINGTRKAVAITITDDLNAPCRHLVPERGRRLKVDWIPGQLDEGFAGDDGVGACNVWAPIAIRVRRSPPNACLLG